jgi:hypothetical protein
MTYATGRSRAALRRPCRRSRAGRPRIMRVLDLSTAHLPREVCADLPGYDRVIAYPLSTSDDHHGWLPWVPPEPAHHADQTDQTDHGEHADQADAGLVGVDGIWRYARKLRCEYVLIDRDAQVIDALPTWPWRAPARFAYSSIRPARGVPEAGRELRECQDESAVDSAVGRAVATVARGRGRRVRPGPVRRGRRDRGRGGGVRPPAPLRGNDARDHPPVWTVGSPRPRPGPAPGAPLGRRGDARSTDEQPGSHRPVPDATAQPREHLKRATARSLVVLPDATVRPGEDHRTVARASRGDRAARHPRRAPARGRGRSVRLATRRSDHGAGDPDAASRSPPLRRPDRHPPPADQNRHRSGPRPLPEALRSAQPADRPDPVQRTRSAARPAAGEQTASTGPRPPTAARPTATATATGSTFRGGAACAPAGEVSEHDG